LSEKQDRQGVRTAMDLERKWQFGKQFAEVMGVATDAQDAVTRVESDLRNEITEQSTSITRTTEEIVFNALKSYVETSDFGEFKRTLETEFNVWAGGIDGRVTATENSIEKVDGELQEKLNTITKYFTFDIDGLTIGQIDNPNKVVIDNDEISILVHNKPVQIFDANGRALIPSLNVSTLMNLLGLQITEDSTHINCDYVGGV
jgi:hypothetical protein